MYQHIKHTKQFQNQPKNKHLILIFLLLDSTWLTWLDSNQLNLTTKFTTFYLFSDNSVAFASDAAAADDFVSLSGVRLVGHISWD